MASLSPFGAGSRRVFITPSDLLGVGSEPCTRSTYQCSVELRLSTPATCISGCITSKEPPAGVELPKIGVAAE